MSPAPASPGPRELTHLTRVAQWRGRRIAWDRDGEGPAVVLLHGTPWSSALWGPIARALSREFTVYRWDMPGYGASSKDAEHAVDLGVQGEAFAHLLDLWGLERPMAVAHDFGGAVALRTRILHGARYAALCLVDAVALTPWGSPFFRLVRDHAEVFAQLPDAMHRGLVEAYIAGAGHRDLRPADLAMLTEPWTGPGGKAAFYRQIAQADERFTTEVEDHYGSITEPVHIVWGADDTWIPVDRAHRLHAAVGHSSLSIIEGAGHLVQLDVPAELAAELTRWARAAGSPESGK